MKGAGIATAVGLSIISLVTGLSLGLKRRPLRVKRRRKKRGSLRPGAKPDHTDWTPLTPAKEVAGGTLVWIGDNIYLVGVRGVALYVWRRKRKC